MLLSVFLNIWIVRSPVKEFPILSAHRHVEYLKRRFFIMEELKREAAERLSRLRNERCLTVEKLADKIGVSKRTLENYERGNIPDFVMVLKRLHECLGVPYDTLIEGKVISDSELYEKIKNLSPLEKKTLLKVFGLIKEIL